MAISQNDIAILIRAHDHASRQINDVRRALNRLERQQGTILRQTRDLDNTNRLFGGRVSEVSRQLSRMSARLFLIGGPLAALTVGAFKLGAELSPLVQGLGVLSMCPVYR